MNYQVVAYTFLKTLYIDHISSNGAICNYDFEKFRTVSCIDEPDGILELIVSYLRGKGLIHMSIPGNDEKKRTYYISLYGVECVYNFENSPEFKMNETIDRSYALSSMNSTVKKDYIVMEHVFMPQQICQTFFLKFI